MPLTCVGVTFLYWQYVITEHWVEMQENVNCDNGTKSLNLIWVG